MNSLVKLVVQKIWLVSVLALVVIAVYVSLGRLMLPRLHQYQAPLESYLSSQLGGSVRMDALTGVWQGLQPVVTLSQLQVRMPGAGEAVALHRLAMRLDLFQSLWQRRPVFSSILIDGLEISLQRDGEGAWRLSGAAAGKRRESIDAIGLLLAQRQIHIDNLAVNLQTREGLHKQILVSNWRFYCVQRACASQGQLRMKGDAEAELSFALNLDGLPDDSDFGLTFYAAWQPLAIEEWLPLTNVRLPVALSMNKFQLGGKIWLTVNNGVIDDVRGNIDVPVLTLAPQGKQLAPVEELLTDFTWTRNADLSGWELRLRDFGFTWRGEEFFSAQQDWIWSKQQDAGTLNLVADALELEFFSNALLAVEQTPPKLRRLLATLEPRGRLINTHLQYRFAQDSAENTLPDFELEANLEEVGVSPWKQAPGGTGINGYLQVSPRGGLVDFTSDNLTLAFPELYSEGWHYRQASGLVSWENQGRAFWLTGEQLHLLGDTGDISGQFSLAVPRGGAEPRLDLLLGMKNAPVKPALTYVPDKKVSPKLTGWLQQALQSGKVNSASFIYSGSTAKGAASDSRTMRLEVDAEAVDLAYLPDWPVVENLSAQVKVKNNDAHIVASTGRIHQVNIDHLVAEFIASDSGGDLSVKSVMKGPLADGLRILKETPIRQALFDLVDDFTATGNMNLALDLGIPLAGQAPLKTSVKLETADAGFAIPSLDLSFTQLSGKFDYSEKSGINAEGVKGYLFGEPFAATFDSRVRNLGGGKSKQHTQIRLDGSVTAGALAKWLKHPLIGRFDGSTDYHAELNFGAAEGNGLVILSRLEGITADLPEPFAKPAQQPVDFAYIIRMDDRPMHYLGYGDQLQFALLYGEHGYRQGEIRVGGEPAVFEDIPGIRLVGDSDYLNVAQWQALLDSLGSGEGAAPVKGSAGVPGSSGEESFAQLLKQVQLKVERLAFAGRDLEQVILEAEQINGDWLLGMENPVVKGRLINYADPLKPLDINLEYLRLPASSAGDADPLQDLEPQSLSMIDFSTDEFSVAGENYGSWSFKIRSNDKGAQIESIQASSRGLAITGQLDWRYAQGSHSSQFSGAVNTRDVGAALEAWQFTRSIESGEASAVGELAWQGSPAMFSLLNTSGDLELASKEGRFLEVEGTANVLRLFGILNFSSLARRIRLDFSDLFKKGYSFDSLKGKLAFEQGEVQIAESLIIDGPSAKFKIDGRTDLVNEQLDQEILVVLPVGDNITIAATIAGAPQVGIPLYLLNKMFGNMFDRFTSARYKVTGSWDDPKIELVKMFDTGNDKRDTKSK